MNLVIQRARVWRLSADIDTDVLAPGAWMKHGLGLYFRNAFNLGLLLLTCPQAENIGEGESIGVQFDPGSDTPQVVRASGELLPCAPIPDFLMAMVQAGGLLPLLKQQRRSVAHGH